MGNELLRNKVKAILKIGLPEGEKVAAEGQSLAKEINIGQTAFLAENGFTSESQYKLHAIKNEQLMVHAHIGMNSWHNTAEALRLLYRAADTRGLVIDRFGLCLDRRMALPRKLRSNVPAETGPTLDNIQDWVEVGQVVPIQPHLGDFMIGFPASTENTASALKAGITTIGNLSQFFSMQTPMWRDTVKTAVETIKAAALLGAFREQGALLHSYLEDGLGALFYDCATVAGWAYLEKYIVEELLGAKLAHCIGGLTSDPVKRAGWVFALREIHGPDGLGSMIYGDTISFTEDLDTNRGMICEYILWDMMAQLVCPTGHAALPLPVTEAIRAPSAEEIIEIQIMGRRLEQTARQLAWKVDFSSSQMFKTRIIGGGKKVFARALEGLQEAGVNIKDPLQMIYVLKELGPAVFEEKFGAGELKDGQPRGRVPVVATDVFVHTKNMTDNIVASLDAETKETLRGMSFLLASTDVHEHALFLLSRLLEESGAQVYNLGAEQNPDDVAEGAEKYSPDAAVISTHNGMALEYALKLKEELAGASSRIPVFMGGKLNQKKEDCVMPVEVTEEIKSLGFFPCKATTDFLKNLKSLI